MKELSTYHWIGIGAALGAVVGYLIGQTGIGIAIGAGGGLLYSIYFQNSAK